MFLMENVNLLTRKVSVFGESFFNVVVSYHYLTVSYQKKTLRIESEWLTGSIKSDFQIHHNSSYYYFLFDCV